MAQGGGTALADAVARQDYAGARDLVASGHDVDAAQADGATPLAWAAHWGEGELARLLLEQGADPNLANELGVTPLMLAAYNGDAELVGDLLAAGADAAAARPPEETALMWASRSSNADVVRRLLAGGADPRRATDAGHTALMFAAAEGHAEVAAVLIESGADVAARTSVRRPPTRATRRSETPPTLSEREAVNPAELPRDGDGDPSRPQGGFTALLHAALAGHRDATEVLLDRGADINETGPDGVTALMVALTKRHEDLAVFLVRRGADPDLNVARPDGDGGEEAGDDSTADTERAGYAGYSALHIASATGQADAVRALLAAGADPNRGMDRPQRFVDAFEVGVFTSPGSGRLTQIGTTPFLLAAKTANADIMRILLEAGADPLATTDDGTTAVALAAGLGKRSATDITYYAWDEARAEEAIAVALAQGVDINARNRYDETALHGAAYHGATRLIRYLVERGAEIDAVNWQRQTPLRVASGHLICCTSYVEQPEAADVLRELGADPEAGLRLTFGLTQYGETEARDGAGGPGAGR